MQDVLSTCQPRPEIVAGTFNSEVNVNHKRFILRGGTAP